MGGGRWVAQKIQPTIKIVLYFVHLLYWLHSLDWRERAEGGGEQWAGKKTKHHKFIIWLYSLHVWERGHGVGWRKIPPTIKIILHLLYVLYWLHLQNLWERGDGGLDTNPTHHQNCIICAVFVILSISCTCYMCRNIGTIQQHIRST